MTQALPTHARSRARSAVDGRSLMAAGLLAISAALLCVVPLTRVVVGANGSIPGPVVGTAWLAALPVVVVIGVLALDRAVGVAAVVGVGVFAVARLVEDAGLIARPDGALRPEWFGVDAVSAFPLHAAWGAAFPLVADLLAVVALALCAAAVFDGFEPPQAFVVGAATAAGPPAVRWTAAGPIPGSVPRSELDGRRRVFRATPVTVVGLLASALILASMLGVQYADPLPTVPPLGVADISIWSTTTAALAGLLLCIAVVSAAALPTAPAQGLLFGIAAATSVAPLTPIVAGIGDAAVRPSALAWVGLAGSLGLVAAALLKRELPVDRTTLDVEAEAAAGDLDSAPPATWHTPALGALVLAAAALALLAYLQPQAVKPGGGTGASFDAAGAGYLPAAVLLFLVGALVLVPTTSLWGRLAMTLAWVPVLSALLTSLEFTSSSIWLSLGGVQRAAGTWWGLAAAVLAGTAGIVAPLINARVRHASTEVVDSDHPDADSAVLPAVAGGLTPLAVLAYALPIYSTNGHPAASLFVTGSRLDGWGAWVGVIVLVAALWSAVGQERRSAAVAIVLAAAAVAATRVTVPASVRAQLDFSIGPGWWVTVGFTIALLLAAPVLWTVIGPPRLLAGTAAAVPARPKAISKAAQRRTAHPPRGKRR